MWNFKYFNEKYASGHFNEAYASGILGKHNASNMLTKLIPRIFECSVMSQKFNQAFTSYVSKTGYSTSLKVCIFQEF